MCHIDSMFKKRIVIKINFGKISGYNNRKDSDIRGISTNTFNSPIFNSLIKKWMCKYIIVKNETFANITKEVKSNLSKL